MNEYIYIYIKHNIYIEDIYIYIRVAQKNIFQNFASHTLSFEEV
jgi:hypothetical protein